MWAREYLPGYTGHVPLKNDLFGKTAGTINKEICESGGNETNMGRIALKQSMMGQTGLPAYAKMNKDVFGNLSRYSVNWISGPTHRIRKQQVPGYTGHVRGMVNKDSMSKSYARVTAALFSKKHPIQVDNTPKGRFTSTQRDEYRVSNNRRFGKLALRIECRPYSFPALLTLLSEDLSRWLAGRRGPPRWHTHNERVRLFCLVVNKDMVPRKDYDDYSKYVNETHQSRR